MSVVLGHVPFRPIDLEGFYSTQTLQRLVLLIKALRSRDQKLLFDTAAGEFGENENL